MQSTTAIDYWLAMSVIDSENYSKLARASSVHAMSKEGRKDYFKQLHKSAQLVNDDKDAKIMTVEQAAIAVGRALNG